MMRAIIYDRETGRRVWSTDNGGHLLGIQKDETFLYSDESSAAPGGDEPLRRLAILRSRKIELDRNAVDLFIDHVEGY